LVLIIIADGVQNGMSGDYMSVTGALVVAMTIFGWSYLLDLLAYRSDRIRNFFESPPLLLIQDGHVIRRNLRRELISDEELRSYLRSQNVEDVNDVQKAYLEPSGELSVQRRQTSGDGPPHHRQRPL
jgi:uncharacterized membrane protein YcaP (DUF421 family)